VRGSNPAERVEVQEAVLVNVAHDEGDLVHVRGEHDFAPPLTGAAPQSKEVAHDVGVELIGVRASSLFNSSRSGSSRPGTAGG
jgi:hypothetical protein